MKYQIAVYFDGPRSVWAGDLQEGECIFIGESPWLWSARSIARGHIGNTGRCSYVITCGGEKIEEFKAAPQETNDEPIERTHSNIYDKDRPGGRV